MLKRIGDLTTRVAKNPRRAAEALFWWLLGRKKRARQMFLPFRTKLDPRRYAAWIEAYDTFDASAREAMRRQAAAWPDQPLISILMPVFGPRLEYLRDAVASVRGQIYTNWELCVTGDASIQPEIRAYLEHLAGEDSRVKISFGSGKDGITRASSSALELASGDFIALMYPDDRLAERSLYEVVRLLHRHPDTDIVYTDEDQIDDQNRRFRPHFKPDWNRELFLAQNYINHLAVIRASLIHAVGGFRPGFEGSHSQDLILRLLGHIDEARIRHISKVLYHLRDPGIHTSMSMHPATTESTARQQAVAEFLQESAPGTEVVPGPGGFSRLVRPLPDPAPALSLIVPTRDRVKLLKTCLEGLLERTDYPDIEVIIADNGSTERQTLDYFETISSDPRVRILSCPGAFNFSAINNRAVDQARGDVIGLINNDIEVIDAGWLREMVSHAVLPEAGAVGCKLIYNDNRIQHAGVILGIGGIADHGHKFFDCMAPGYFYRPQIQQYVSAVTAACLVVSREKYLAVGGLNETELAVAFNDVDFCLRLNERGWKNIYTPYATLYHHESMSRGRDRKGAKAARHAGEIAYMEARWGELLVNDPYYNPNLARDGESFTLKKLRPGREGH